ncbi:hypothetical protein GTP45_25570 [Pseudoduganella sp. FT55W]|uniref:PEP-CTERM sorting domain-containing protein n=1 Tax=Duganella rivi TaxID=2666083 RepID=A0A7X4KEK6_9BURK|nr:hypothetical protein [Duganella rivi]MYM70147.1 hypothetical protein [Duganella rivi]
MKRLISLVLLGALLGAGPAYAMRAREYIDADQRAAITLAAERAQTINIAPALETASNTDEAQLPTPEQRAKATAATPVVSSVPEPSGLALLACGLVLLLLAPSGRDHAGITPAMAKPLSDDS